MSQAMADGETSRTSGSVFVLENSDGELVAIEICYFGIPMGNDGRRGPSLEVSSAFVILSKRRRSLQGRLRFRLPLHEFFMEFLRLVIFQKRGFCVLQRWQDVLSFRRTKHFNADFPDLVHFLGVLFDVGWCSFITC